MRGLSLIIVLLGVFALLTLGVGSAWARADAPATCHDEVPSHGAQAVGPQTHGSHATGNDAPDPSRSPWPAKAAMAMACCVACVSPALPIAPTAIVMIPPRPIHPALFDLPGGRSSPPEPGPPKTRP